MNFDDIKKQMNTASENKDDIEINTKQIGNSKLPLDKVRLSMKSEIITQLLFILVFLGLPSVVPMETVPKGVYYIIMFVTCLITSGYLLKMGWFLKRSSDISQQSKYALLSILHDLKLTLEVYKTAIIAGSLLLPLAMVTLNYAAVNKNEDEFIKLLSLDIAPNLLAIYLLIYLAIAVLIYFITVKWADKLYGGHVKKLEAVVNQFEVD